MTLQFLHPNTNKPLHLGHVRNNLLGNALANVYPYTPIRSSFENAGSIEEMMLYTELQSAVHAMIQRLEYTRRSESAAVAEWRRRSISSLIALSFSI